MSKQDALGDVLTKIMNSFGTPKWPKRRKKHKRDEKDKDGK